jgi:hypothetical protein
LPKLKVNSKNFSKSSRLRFTDAGGQAKALALDAFLYIAKDQEHLARFLGETGFDPADLRRTAHEPGFAAAMLDYLCSNETVRHRRAAAASCSASPARLRWRQVELRAVTTLIRAGSAARASDW